MSNESPTPGGESAPDRGPLSTDQPGPDDLFAHGLLGFVHTDTPERQRQRVTRAMHAIHAGDVAAVAGYVLGASGKTYVVTLLVNHPTVNRGGGSELINALLRWTYQQP